MSRKDYVFWLFKKYKSQLFFTTSTKEKNLVKQKIPHTFSYRTAKHQKKEVGFSFQTRISSAFETHATFFYSNQATKKTLGLDLSFLDSIITPKALAYWYMDDGSWPNKESKSFILCTHGYKVSEVSYLSNLLNTKFDLVTKIGFNKQQPIIRISAKRYPVFYSLINPTLKNILSMKSKFPINSLLLEDIV